jgi:hypothetical protein
LHRFGSTNIGRQPHYKHGNSGLQRCEHVHSPGTRADTRPSQLASRNRSIDIHYTRDRGGVQILHASFPISFLLTFPHQPSTSITFRIASALFNIGFCQFIRWSSRPNCEIGCPPYCRLYMSYSPFVGSINKTVLCSSSISVAVWSNLFSSLPCSALFL